MKKEEFKSLWKSKFSDAYPIGHELKLVYENRWFRIHSLPESKRYAETKDEYQIIYERHNEIIEDLIGENEEIVLSFGLYGEDVANSNYKEITEFREFDKVDTIEFHKIRPDENEDELCFDIYAKSTIWKSNRRNETLKAIADDKIRMMIISFDKKRIINPYDGGIDLILESEEVRDKYKLKYQKWLSKHPKGL